MITYMTILPMLTHIYIQISSVEKFIIYINIRNQKMVINNKLYDNISIKG